MNTEHEIKIATEYYGRVLSGQKTFEIRENDRDYQVGDTLLMREYDPRGKDFINYSAPIHAKIVYMTSFQQKDGWVVLGIEVKNEP